MKKRKVLLLGLLISLLAAAPGTAIQPENETTDGCCMTCAHYIYTNPDGQAYERWDCMGLDCRSGYRDCWEHHTSSKACVLMWSCSIF